MKQELDVEMEKRHLDFFVLTGPRYCNPDIMYLLGEAHIMNPTIVKKRGEEMVVIHNAMERGEIERYGLRGIDQEEICRREELQGIDGAFERVIYFNKRLVEYLGIGGRVAFYGISHIHNSWFMLERLLRECPEIEMVFDGELSLFQQARLTKDRSEYEILKDISRRTSTIFRKVMSYLGRQKVKKSVLVGKNGAPVTLGDVRRYCAVLMAETGLETPEIPIISTGKDAAIPHSKGDDSSPVEVGRPVIMDIFPRCLRTGYMSDITRTICIGSAPPRIAEAYQAVMEARELALSEVRAGNRLASPDKKVSDFFRERGFTTLSSDPQARQGYIHSLGHGVGLELHEGPRLSVFNTDESLNAFMPGMVFTLEPGLYFPEEEFGIRVEDMVYMRDDGEIEILSDAPRVLEIHPKEV